MAGRPFTNVYDIISDFGIDVSKAQHVRIYRNDVDGRYIQSSKSRNVAARYNVYIEPLGAVFGPTDEGGLGARDG